MKAVKDKVDPDRIKDRMIALGKDPTDGGQTWLAREVGMSQQGIQSILAGDVRRPGKLREISVALQTTEDYLLGKSDKAPPKVGLTPEMAIRLSELFTRLLKSNGDLQYQIANYIEKRLDVDQAQSRDTAT